MSEKDKQIYLFCSRETDRLARSVQDNTGILPNSNISEKHFRCLCRGYGRSEEWNRRMDKRDWFLKYGERWNI